MNTKAGQLDNAALIALWKREMGAKPAIAQYVSAVRSFSGAFGNGNLCSAGEDDLVAYASAIESSASRARAISALNAFYGFLLDRGSIDRDPARHLSERVRRGQLARATIDELVTAGMRDEDARALVWRDVAMALFCNSRRKRATALARAGSPVLERLGDQFLKRIQNGEAKDLARILDNSVFM